MDAQRLINDQIRPHLPEHAWHSTVAIVLVHDGAVHQFGSGVLFRVADESFVVTAGHVAKQANQHEKTLGITAANGTFVATPGQWLSSAPGQHGSLTDPFDVAIYALPPSAVEQLSGKTFLRFDDIDFDPKTPTSVYTLFGFPAVWSAPSTSDSNPLQLKAFQYTTTLYDRDTDSIEDYQERFHLLLDAQLEHTSCEDGSPARFHDLQGAAAPFPGMLGGISGCSVWWTGDLKVPMETWSKERSRLVAVQTGVLPTKRAIKATRWVAVSTLIHSAFPALRPAMELVRLS
jgi:hypothetical protein